jgi:hypothetical protein
MDPSPKRPHVLSGQGRHVITSCLRRDIGEPRDPKVQPMVCVCGGGACLRAWTGPREWVLRMVESVYVAAPVGTPVVIFGLLHKNYQKFSIQLKRW